MALPASGTISIGDIRNELLNTGTNNYRLSYAGQYNGSVKTSGYVPINRASTSKPNDASAYAISEWYSYNHSASKACSGTGFTMDGINQQYIYYKLAITSYGAGCTSTINFTWTPSGSFLYCNQYVDLYNSYPFSNTGTIVPSPIYSNNGTTGSYNYTCTGTTDYLHVVTWLDDPYSNPCGYYTITANCGSTPSSTLYCLGYNSGSNCASACSDSANCGNF
jgi:hypothetical protein